jgi:membrane protein
MTMAETGASAQRDQQDGERREVPAGPAELGAGGWLAAIGRSAKEFGADNLQDRAAALTYYSIQSIFPGLLVLVSLLGLLGKSATQPLITELGKSAPANVRQILLQALDHLQRDHAAAGILAVVGIAGGLWSDREPFAELRDDRKLRRQNRRHRDS